MDDRLLALITEGAVGGVGVGATQAQVREALGDPTDLEARRPPRIWKYDDVELHFTEGRVWLLQIDTDRLGVTRAMVDRLLADHGIDQSDYAPLTFDDQTAVEAESGAVMVFDMADRLVAVSVAAWR